MVAVNTSDNLAVLTYAVKFHFLSAYPTKKFKVDTFYSPQDMKHYIIIGVPTPNHGYQTVGQAFYEGDINSERFRLSDETLATVALLIG